MATSLPILYAATGTGAAYNDALNQLAERLNPPDLEDFKRQNHYGVAKRVHGNEDEAADALTTLLYGSEGRGELERAHSNSPHRPLLPKFRFLVRFGPKQMERRKRNQRKGGVGVESVDSYPFEPVASDDPQSEALLRLIEEEEQPKPTPTEPQREVAPPKETVGYVNPKADPVSEEDKAKLLSILDGRTDGVDVWKELKNRFKPSKAQPNRLYDVIRSVGAHVEAYPHSDRGSPKWRVFHPDLQPSTNPLIEDWKKTWAEHMEGRQGKAIADSRGLRKQQIYKRLRTIKKILEKKSQLLGRTVDRYKAEKKDRLSCVYLPLTGEIKGQILKLGQQIPDEVLTEKGRETEPHCTLFYGLLDDDPTAAFDSIRKFGRPVRMYLGPVTVFSNDDKDYDVVKVSVLGLDLHFLNHVLKRLPNKSDFPDYRPHVTLGYVKKGEGQKVAQQLGRVDAAAECRTVVFSDSEKNKKRMQLGTTMKPTKYEAEKPTLTAHEIVRYFPIEHFLRTLAEDPRWTDSGRQLAHHVLTTGDVSGLWPLSDELFDTGHPLQSAGYRLLNAVPKLLLDSAVGHGLEAVERRHPNPGRHSTTQDALALLRYYNVADHPTAVYPEEDPEYAHDNAAHSVIQLLKGQGHSTKDISDSLERHQRRIDNRFALRLGATTPEKLTEKATTAPLNEDDPDRYSAKADLIRRLSVAKLIDSAVRRGQTGAMTPEVAADWNQKLSQHGPLKVGHPEDFHSLTSVLSGAKPSALVSEEFLTQHPVGMELDKRLSGSGMNRERVTVGNQQKVLIGKPTSVVAAKSALASGNHGQLATALGVPTKYRQTPALSDFISAVRQVRSSNQEVRRSIASAQFEKLKLKIQSIRDAIADAPHTASANVASAVEHDGDQNRVMAAAALLGLQTQSPSLLVFHSDPQGPHNLLKFDVTGSAEKLRRRMDQFGLTNRTLLPTQNGWSVVLVDPDGSLTPKVKEFADSEGTKLQSTRGVGQVIGSGDEAEANKGDRQSYRNILKEWDKTQSPQPQQSTNAGH